MAKLGDSGGVLKTPDYVDFRGRKPRNRVHDGQEKEKFVKGIGSASTI
jgi:hypothetical protein